MHELGNTLSDQDVNAVASQHFDAQQVRKRCFGCSVAVLKSRHSLIPAESYHFTTGISED